MHALIIANGPLPHPDFVRGLVRYASKVICADGGANKAKSLGIRPTIIIGDFDSIEPETREFFFNVEQAEIDDGSSTDLEKAIDYCIKKEMTSVDIVGALGARIDHTVGSIGCFKRYGHKIHIRMIDTEGELTLIRQEIHLTMHKGEKLSLIPLEKCTGVTTTNLKYPLTDDFLQIGEKEGISNEAISENVSIKVGEGSLLLFRFLGLAWQSHGIRA